MENIGGINNNSLATVANATASSKQKETSLKQNDFLQLLVAQMSNQDPVNPQDPGSFLGQLAQFGTVDGISELNNSMSQLSSGLTSNQALQASSLVGRNVDINSEYGVLTQEDGLNGTVTLEQSVKDLRLVITDASGEVVKELPLGDKQAGNVQFKWDGMKDDGDSCHSGNYHIKAMGSVAGQNYAFPTLVSANVDSVTIGQGDRDVALNLKGLGSVLLRDVTKIS